MSFIRVKMSQKNKIALGFVCVGLLSCIVLSYHLPPEKLSIALVGPTALIGAGLAEWSNRDD